MGNTSGMVIFMAAFSLFSIIFTLSIYAVDPCSDTLLGNNLFLGTTGSQLGYSSFTCSNGIISYSNINFSNDLYSRGNISRGTTQGTGVGATIASVFPDWLFTGFSYITTAGAFIVNIVSAPYTVATDMFPASMKSFAAVIGAFFSVIFMFFLINYITGRDN